MAITPLKALLFAVGGTAAAGGVAYVSGALDPYFSDTPPAEIANVPPAPATDAAAPAAPADNAMKPAAPADEAAKPAEEPAKPAEVALAPADEGTKPAEAGDNAMKPAAPADNAMAPAAPADEAAKPAAPADAAANPNLPTFDVVRVEDNGSIVVAGQAAPNAKVEILNGDAVLGSTDAGPDGAFAIVLDEPLKPGDYQLSLRATVPPNPAVVSQQTAVVSIPDKPGGQVLAMVEEPGKAAELLTVPSPEKPADQAAAAAAEPEPAKPAEAAASPAAPADQAAAPAEAKTGPAPAEPAAPAATAPAVVVKAVEIEGGKIFVAGTADAGRKVRAYVNEDVLGEATAAPDGNFLVEASKDLAVGDYTIRVDALDADGAKVVARASVPFQREPGEAIAAVAPDQPAETKPAEVAAAEQPAAPATSDPAAPPATADAPKPAEPATAAEQPAAPAAEQPAAPAAEQPADVAAAPPSDGVPETTAPKLQHVDSAVIIKRGDSLWRISRKVYGRGVRYSTIYLANQQQIGDPDRIWPGQVFKVPEKSSDGQAADMTKVGEQATTMPPDAGTEQKAQ